MLGPDIVKRLRAKVDAGEDPVVADGYFLNTAVIQPVAQQESVLLQSEPEWKGELAGPVHIFGKPHDSRCLNGVGRFEQQVPEKRLFRVENAKVIGNNCLLTAQGGLFCPSPVSSDQDFARLRQINGYNHQGFVFSESERQRKVYYAGRENPARISQRIMYVHNVESANYGSFIFRQLPQLLFADPARLEFDAYVVPDRTHWFIEALQLSGWPSKPIFTVREVSGDVFDEVLICSEFDSEGAFGPSTLTRMRRLASSVDADSSDSREKIFVSRRLSTIYRPNYRVMSNEAEIEAMAVTHGYSVVTPETLSLSRQIQLFRHARKIAGASGSGMLNSAFNIQGARLVDMESYTGAVRQHSKIYGSAELEFSFLFGILDPADPQTPAFRRWHVPLEIARDGFAWLES